MPSLQDLPEELLLMLCGYLSGGDLLSLSHANARLRRVLADRRLWQKVAEREGVDEEETVRVFVRGRAAADNMQDSCSKLSYLAHRRLRRNWRSGRHAEPQSIALSDGFRAGHDDRHLVVTEPHPSRKNTWYLRAWDLASPSGVQPLLAGGPGARQKFTPDFGAADFDFAPVSVMVASGVALVNFAGRGSDTPQELVAFEIPDAERKNGGKFRQLWRDSIDEWGHFQLPNLFAGDVYKFNLLTNRIDVFNIRSFRQIHSIPLVEEMRYPRGDVSGDGRHLAIPGKLAHDNSPAISVWTLSDRAGGGRLSGSAVAQSQRFLVPNTAMCPFRWFEKTAVRDGLVYGLLNRRCLFVWNADTRACLSRTELTDAVPGDAEPALNFTFLSVGDGLVATIHKNPSAVTLLSPTGEETVATVEVPPPAMAQPAFVAHPGTASGLKVVDTFFTRHCLLVRSANLAHPDFQLTAFPLASLVGERRDVDCGSGAGDVPVKRRRRRLEGTSAAIALAPVTDCVRYELGVTPTKLLNFARRELRVLDYLC